MNTAQAKSRSSFISPRKNNSLAETNGDEISGFEFNGNTFPDSCAVSPSLPLSKSPSLPLNVANLHALPQRCDQDFFAWNKFLAEIAGVAAFDYGANDRRVVDFLAVIDLRAARIAGRVVVAD